MEDLRSQIARTTDEFFDQSPGVEERDVKAEESFSPVDLYQRDRNRIYDVSQKSYPKGSSRAVEMATYGVIDGNGAEGLGHAYRRAKDDINTLKERGERGRAELVKTQYMQEHFLPAIEVVVAASSPDELLNDNRALAELDKYALLDGASKGYTASYIRQAYGNQLGQKTGRSDSVVRAEIIKINQLLDMGEIRMAHSAADRIKKKIDDGGAMADDLSYDFLGRVVSFYE